MLSRHLNLWRLLLGLVIFSALVPLPEPLDKILSLLGAVPLLVLLGADWWKERRERQADQSSSAAVSSGEQM